MADQLLNIRRLDWITLYPAVSDGCGPDFNARSMTLINSLREIELPLSEQKIAALERRFPNLKIQLAQKPIADSAVDPEIDGTDR